MKKNEVQIGGLYTAKVSNRLTTVRIERENPYGGWDAINTTTGKPVRIKTAQRLRAVATAADDAKPQRLARKRVSPGDNKTKPAGEKRMSCLDAAAKVLAESDGPMDAKQMIDAMAAKGYWISPGGKTPHATLHAAITREIKTRGDKSRFAKVDRGQFSINQETQA